MARNLTVEDLLVLLDREEEVDGEEVIMEGSDDELDAEDLEYDYLDQVQEEERGTVIYYRRGYIDCMLLYRFSL